MNAHNLARILQLDEFVEAYVSVKIDKDPQIGHESLISQHPLLGGEEIDAWILWKGQ